MQAGLGFYFVHHDSIILISRKYYVIDKWAESLP